MIGDPKVCDIGVEEKKPGVEMDRFFAIAMAQMMTDLWKPWRTTMKRLETDHHFVALRGFCHRIIIV